MRSKGISGKATIRLRDEVYRQMFRLDASRPGADLDLALALLEAWVALPGGGVGY